jgi:hypothetical protein
MGVCSGEEKGGEDGENTAHNSITVAESLIRKDVIHLSSRLGSDT